MVKEEQPNPGMMGIYNDSFIDEYKKLTNLVHSYGSKIIMQIAYGGTKTTFNLGKELSMLQVNLQKKVQMLLARL